MAGVEQMEAMSILNERRPYRDIHAEARRLLEEQSTSLGRIEMLEELTLTLLKEIALIKDIQKIQTQAEGHRVCLADEVRRFEIGIIRQTLARTKGHQARAARLLGLNATTLNAKLKRYGIDPNPLSETETGANSCDEAGERES
jgi:DNA-binding NtrC family response regulator